MEWIKLSIKMKDGSIAYMTINPVHITGYVVSEVVLPSLEHPGTIVYINGVEDSHIFEETPGQITNILKKIGHTIMPIPSKNTKRNKTKSINASIQTKY